MKKHGSADVALGWQIGLRLNRHVIAMKIMPRTKYFSTVHPKFTIKKPNKEISIESRS